MTSLFGWSAGDIADATEFLFNIAKHLRANGGAVTKLDEARNILKAMKQVLDLVALETQNAQGNDAATKAVLDLLGCATGSWRKFYEYLRDFDQSLRPGSSSNSGLRVVKHFQFTHDELHDQMAKLENAIALPLQMINVVRGRDLYQSATAARNLGLSAQQRLDVVSAMQLALDQTPLAGIVGKLEDIEMSVLSSRSTADRGIEETRRLGEALDLLTRQTAETRRLLATAPSSRFGSSSVRGNGQIPTPFDVDFDSTQLELLRKVVELSQQLEGATVTSLPDGRTTGHATVSCEHSVRTLLCMMVASSVTGAMVGIMTRATTLTLVSAPHMALPPTVPSSNDAGTTVLDLTDHTTNAQQAPNHSARDVDRHVRKGLDNNHQTPQKVSHGKEPLQSQDQLSVVIDRQAPKTLQHAKPLPTLGPATSWPPPDPSYVTTVMNGEKDVSSDDNPKNATGVSAASDHDADHYKTPVRPAKNLANDFYLRRLLWDIGTDLCAYRKRQEVANKLVISGGDPPLPSSSDFPDNIEWRYSRTLQAEFCDLRHSGLIIIRHARSFPKIPLEIFDGSAPSEEMLVTCSATLAFARDITTAQRMPRLHVIRSCMTDVRDTGLHVQRIKQAFGPGFENAQWSMVPQPSAAWTSRFSQYTEKYPGAITSCSPPSPIQDASSDDDSLGYQTDFRQWIKTPHHDVAPALVTSSSSSRQIPEPAYRHPREDSDSVCGNYVFAQYEILTRSGYSKEMAAARIKASTRAYASKTQYGHAADDYSLFNLMLNAGLPKRDAMNHIQKLATARVSAMQLDYGTSDRRIYAMLRDRGVPEKEAMAEAVTRARLRIEPVASNVKPALTKDDFAMFEAMRHESLSEETAEVHIWAVKTRRHTDVADEDAATLMIMMCAGWPKDEAIEELHASIKARIDIRRPELAVEDAATLAVLAPKGYSTADAVATLVQKEIACAYSSAKQPDRPFRRAIAHAQAQSTDSRTADEEDNGKDAEEIREEEHDEGMTSDEGDKGDASEGDSNEDEEIDAEGSGEAGSNEEDGEER